MTTNKPTVLLIVISPTGEDSRVGTLHFKSHHSEDRVTVIDEVLPGAVLCPQWDIEVLVLHLDVSHECQKMKEAYTILRFIGWSTIGKVTNLLCTQSLGRIIALLHAYYNPNTAGGIIVQMWLSYSNKSWSLIRWISLTMDTRAYMNNRVVLLVKQFVY